MVDITKHLLDLNLKLQGKDQIITNMCDQVNAFKCKLVLWEKQLKNEDLMHFPTCNMYKSSLGETASYQKYAEKNLSLRNEFETRFSDFKSLEGKFALFSSIFSINIESVPNHMQMEVIDIQCDSDLKAKFIEVGVSEFYKYLPARFENTRKLAYEIMPMFGSTYRCEQLFSLMKGNKSPIRSRITDVHLGVLPLDLKIAAKNELYLKKYGLGDAEIPLEPPPFPLPSLTPPYYSAPSNIPSISFHVAYYTDGSKTRDGVDAGLYKFSSLDCEPEMRESHVLSPHCSVFQAEALGSVKALENATTLPDHITLGFLLDNLSVVKLVLNSKTGNHLINRALLLISRLNSNENRYTLQWIKDHSEMWVMTVRTPS
ncbi:GTF2IRD2 [Cordylochernes scorpioides]|uniref:GTF2IRD2 n=1 Tax=Cordylochernes scorpioides TaxID=51811 RepID=A0ABY6KCS8_9ARAC|nr:GTF2IRD2 [Cordylochernes scorpioides]